MKNWKPARLFRGKNIPVLLCMILTAGFLCGCPQKTAGQKAAAETAVHPAAVIVISPAFQEDIHGLIGRYGITDVIDNSVPNNRIYSLHTEDGDIYFCGIHYESAADNAAEIKLGNVYYDEDPVALENVIETNRAILTALLGEREAQAITEALYSPDVQKKILETGGNASGQHSLTVNDKILRIQTRRQSENGEKILTDTYITKKI